MEKHTGNALFDTRLTLGTLVSLVIGLASVVGVTLEVSSWGENVVARVSVLEAKVDDLGGKIDKWGARQMHGEAELGERAGAPVLPR